MQDYDVTPVMYKKVLLPPQGFSLLAKTWGGTLGVPGVYIQGQRIFVEKARNVFVVGLTKLGAHGRLG